MQIDELKKLIKNSMSVLVLDQGEPSFVILDYKVYQELMGEHVAEHEVKITQVNKGYADPYDKSHIGHSIDREAETIERLNKEILALKNRIEAEEKSISGQDY